MKTTLKPGTAISYKSNIYHVDYAELLMCPADCPLDHDCYPEPYLAVKQIIGTAIPVSQIDAVWDNGRVIGRKFSQSTDIKV